MTKAPGMPSIFSAGSITMGWTPKVLQPSSRHSASEGMRKEWPLRVRGLWSLSALFLGLVFLSM